MHHGRRIPFGIANRPPFNENNEVITVSGSYRIEAMSLNTLLYRECWRFTIPDFQRGFVWDASKVDEMFEDFRETSREFERSHHNDYLMGNIVLVKDGDENMSVIDGQQRLTTLTLLARGIVECILNPERADGVDLSSEESWLRTVVPYYRVDADPKDGDWVSLVRSVEHVSPRLVHSQDYGKTYLEIIQQGRARDRSSCEASDPSRKVQEVYEAILENLEDIIRGPGREKEGEAHDALAAERFRRFLYYFDESITLIVTTTSEIDKAFKLFEVLNDRGAQLNALDLIKNHLLSLVSNDPVHRNSMANDFKVIAKHVKPNNTKQFLKYFCVARKGRKISDGSFFRLVKDDVQDAQAALSFVEDLVKYAEYYANFKKRGGYKQFLNGEQNRDMHILYDVIRVMQFTPVFMRFHDSEIPAGFKRELAAALCRLGVATAGQDARFNKLETSSADMIRRYNEEVEKHADEPEVIEHARKKILEELDELTSEKLVTLEAYLRTARFSNNKATQILKIIELLAFPRSSGDTMQSGRYKPSLEHVLCQKSDPERLEGEGFVDVAQRKESIGLLGNFTLLEKQVNSRQRDVPFSEKRGVYANSRYFITRTLGQPFEEICDDKDYFRFPELKSKFDYSAFADGKEWTREAIDQRTVALAEALRMLLDPARR